MWYNKRTDLPPNSILIAEAKNEIKVSNLQLQKLSFRGRSVMEKDGVDEAGTRTRCLLSVCGLASLHSKYRQTACSVDCMGPTGQHYAQTHSKPYNQLFTSGVDVFVPYSAATPGYDPFVSRHLAALLLATSTLRYSGRFHVSYPSPVLVCH